MNEEYEHILENWDGGCYDFNPWVKEDIAILFDEIRRRDQRYADLYCWMVKEFLSPEDKPLPAQEEFPF